MLSPSDAYLAHPERLTTAASILDLATLSKTSIPGVRPEDWLTDQRLLVQVAQSAATSSSRYVTVDREGRQQTVFEAALEYDRHRVGDDRIGTQLAVYRATDAKRLWSAKDVGGTRLWAVAGSLAVYEAGNALHIAKIPALEPSTPVE